MMHTVCDVAYSHELDGACAQFMKVATVQQTCNTVQPLSHQTSIHHGALGILLLLLLLLIIMVVVVLVPLMQQIRNRVIFHSFHCPNKTTPTCEDHSNTLPFPA